MEFHIQAEKSGAWANLMAFILKLKTHLGWNTTVHTQRHENYIYCKNLAEVISKGEIFTVLEKECKLEELEGESIVSLRKVHGGTQAKQRGLVAEKFGIRWAV